MRAVRSGLRVTVTDLRKPQDYFHRVWSTALCTNDLADAADDQQTENSDMAAADSAYLGQENV